MKIRNQIQKMFKFVSDNNGDPYPMVWYECHKTLSPLEIWSRIPLASWLFYMADIYKIPFDTQIRCYLSLANLAWSALKERHPDISTINDLSNVMSLLGNWSNSSDNQRHLKKISKVVHEILEKGDADLQWDINWEAASLVNSIVTALQARFSINRDKAFFWHLGEHVETLATSVETCCPGYYDLDFRAEDFVLPEFKEVITDELKALLIWSSQTRYCFGRLDK